MNKILGIDLGTTYSCVSYVDASGKPVVLKNSEGELTTPSAVFFEAESTVVVGTPAKESSRLYPGEVVSFAKRHMGQLGSAWNIHGINRSPEEVSSYILRKLVNDAVEVLRSENKLEPDETIHNVVITCPAYFGLNEREATRKAGEIAGLNVLNIINEPTAAAITYGMADAHNNELVLVYDLGGGTFDTTMIDIQPGSIKVVCTGGDHMLGGKLWDDRVIEYIAAEFANQTGNTEDILADPETLQELVLSAERAKKMLSAREKAPIGINYKGERARIELTRDKFDALTADLLERTIQLTMHMLEEAELKGYKRSYIGEILLVGGSSRMPQIMKRIKEEFTVPVKIYDPDEAVAKGAALYASRQAFFNEVLALTSERTGKSIEELQAELDSGKADIKSMAEQVELSGETPQAIAEVDIVNVTSRSFGTIAFENLKAENRQQVLYNMILKNAELPAKMAQRFFTIIPDQKTVTIRVLESLTTGRQAAPEDGTEIGEAILELPDGLPVASPLEIEFRLNESGLLELRATELEHGRDVTARFETADAITPVSFDQAKQRMEESMIY